jgi:hypothetical protein
MTHYKKHWMQLLASRLSQGKRIIIQKNLFAQFLCYIYNSEWAV